MFSLVQLCASNCISFSRVSIYILNFSLMSHGTYLSAHFSPFPALARLFFPSPALLLAFGRSSVCINASRTNNVHLYFIVIEISEQQQRSGAKKANAVITCRRLNYPRCGLLVSGGALRPDERARLPRVHELASFGTLRRQKHDTYTN